MKPTARSLVLDVLSAVGGQDVPVRALVRVAEVFSISDNSLRVALARLLTDGKVENNDRGCYGLAPAAFPVQRHVTSWSRLQDRLLPWRGGWIGVHTAGLGKRDRTAVRHRQRAIDFIGLRELSSGLWVRPDNLRGGAAGVRDELVDLGLEKSAVVFAASDFDQSTESRARRLWDSAAIQRGYAKTRRELEASGARLHCLPLEKAMLETFALGGGAIRQLAFDPLLPEPIVSAKSRRELIEAMRAYERTGRQCWQRFMREQGAPALESLLSFHDPGRAA